MDKAVRGTVMPVCRFCGTPCEGGRNPQPGWLCNACHRWQDDRHCYACGQKTTDQSVAAWQARRPEGMEHHPVWAAGTTPATEGQRND
jgi:hypothetical protein